MAGILDLFGMGNLSVPQTPSYKDGTTLYKAPTKQNTGIFGDVLGNHPVDIRAIKDPFSGKYYGEASGSEISTRLAETLKGIEASIKQYSDPRFTSIPNPQGQGIFSLGSTYLTPEKRAASLAEFNKSLETQKALISDFNDKGYSQQSDFFRSYDTYSGDWQKSWEGQYKNPRLAEAQESRNLLQTSDSGLEINAKRNLKTPKTVGTGLSSSGSINPFGTLDAGLNI